MKKLVSLLMALAMLLSVGAMAEDLSNINTDSMWPIVNEPISVTIAAVPQGGATIDVNHFWQIEYIARQSNLDVEWNLIDSSARAERISLMLNSGDMPDAIWFPGFTTSDILEYGVYGGLLYPINELMEYTPNFAAFLEEYPELKSAITASDGNIYGYPSYSGEDLNVGPRLYIRKDWLEQTGMERPQTLDELYDMLVYFRDHDMDGDGDATNETPWGMSWTDDGDNRAYLLNAYGYAVSGTSNLTLKYKDGEAKPVYVPYDEDYKSYLTFMNKLWNEGLIDKDAFTQTNIQLNAHISDNAVGMAYMAAPETVGFPMQTDPDCPWYATYMLRADEDHQAVVAGNKQVGDYGAIVISADCDKETAVAMARLADTHFDLWHNITYRYGVSSGGEYDYWDEGSAWLPDVDDSWVTYKLAEGVDNSWSMRISYQTFCNAAGHANSLTSIDAFAKAYPDEEWSKYVAAKGGTYPSGWEIFTDIREEAKVAPYPSFFMSEEDNEEVSRLQLALDEYVKGMEARFITGDVSLDEFDAFTAKLESIGVNRLMEIVDQYWTEYTAA